MFRHRPAQRAIRHVVFQCGLALSLLVAGMVAPLPAAADPVGIPQGPIPLDEALEPVELSFVAIDTTLSTIDEGTLADTRTRTRLRNPEKRESYERQVTFPDGPVADVRIGTQNGGTRPAEDSPPYTLSLGPDGDAVIEARQRSVATGALIEISFDWSRLAVWGTPLSAGRLTLHFPDTVSSEQILAIDPEPTQRDTTQLTWSYEKFDPSGEVRVLLIAPQYWAAARNARRAAWSAEATAEDRLALADALRPLIAAEGMPEAVVEALQAELLAALRQAVAADPSNARAHSELAAYLEAHASDDPALLAEAVAERKAAYDMAPHDGELKQQLLGGIDAFMAACRRAGDTHGLLTALDMAEAVSPQGSQERAAAYAELIVGLLEEGRMAEAEATIIAGFGQEALGRYAYYKPHFSLVSGQVETLIDRRVLHLTFAPYESAAEAAENDLAALAGALGRISGAEVQRSGEQGHSAVQVIVPFSEPSDLHTAGQALVGALPEDADPALQLAVAAVAPAGVSFQTTEKLQGDLLAYAEKADLSPARAALAERLQQLESARLEAQAETSDPVEAARRRWVQALLQQYDAGWRALATSCQVTYKLLPPEDIVAPQWTLAWGEQRSLAWSTVIPRYERILPYVIGIAVALIALLILIAVGQRRRRHV